MFSVVVPLYNKEKSISRTIQTVLSQTFDQFELLVINDGSTDRSELEVRKFDDQRIRIINKDNGGVSSARNLGIKNSKFNYVAFLDGDDLWDKQFLETIYDLIVRYDDASIFATGFAKVNFNGDIQKENVVNEEGLIANYFSSVIKYKHSIICSSSVCVQRSLFDICGGFKETLTHGEDLDMWERLARVGKIAISPVVLSRYVEDSENRAMHRLPILAKTRVYNINFDITGSIEERQYYKNEIVKAIRRSLASLRLFRAIKLYFKFLHVIPFFTIFLKAYPARK